MKHLEHNQDFRLNEILFEHRNKAYGAYALRTESDRILTKAFFVGVGLLAAVSIIPAAISAFKTKEVVTTFEPVYRPKNIIPDTPEKPKPVETVKPVQPVTPPNTKQFNSQVPTPTKEAIEPIKMDKPKDAVAGLIDNLKGDPVKPDTHIPPTPIIGTGKITEPVQKPVEKVEDPNKIAEGSELSKSADFEGGIDAFRNKVMNKFDVSAFEEEGVISTKITFVVETDGTISNIKANGKDASFNAEAIRTIKAVKGKWVPGKNKKNESVRSYFSFPISMKFDN
ncbi:hypothetical protein BA768_14370 [Chryseobacterium sp. CBo1]|uniref:hypothetical protein n=1 Tax=Chryseobacterium sp. CBo1 TaxID=1869230 RepID=UPI000810EDA9|nr:hypothetical protein [Chryseobacterium sp. CBo1]OCK52106.1 hypothetical protein BA768_14370 [Chryseobacterium sp. CBo1]